MPVGPEVAAAEPAGPQAAVVEVSIRTKKHKKKHKKKKETKEEEEQGKSEKDKDGKSEDTTREDESDLLGSDDEDESHERKKRVAPQVEETVKSLHSSSQAVGVAIKKAIQFTVSAARSWDGDCVQADDINLMLARRWRRLPCSRTKTQSQTSTTPTQSCTTRGEPTAFLQHTPPCADFPSFANAVAVPFPPRW